MKSVPVMRIAISGICGLLSGVGAAVAMPMDMTVDRLLDICEARTVEAASAKGDELGWQRLADTETEEWRTNFVAYNGGTVELVGWRREQAGGDESLSFWIAAGPNEHKACAYSTTEPAGVLSALSERLGEPDSLEENDAIEMISAWWTRGKLQYSLTQVGSSATINIGPSL
ncbi:hypothetical protein [Devosia nitrariae]|uniref:Uncharacterized protein n=1 Tax=Devosia nitrariae TaxID=2071872 RepID=A0ABQ5VYQ3_9HYPH|nr:hypothetical protein [Devosia nitrariae]GLQ52743.1 hypothetical protein GCM10010862_00010 [Devosia nitrariae]